MSEMFDFFIGQVFGTKLIFAFVILLFILIVLTLVDAKKEVILSLIPQMLEMPPKSHPIK